MVMLTIKEDNIDKILREKESQIKKALTIIGINAEKYAKQALTDQGAVDTGRLRNSVSNAVDRNTVAVGTNVEYAPYIELGTSRMRERPFIKPSIYNHVVEYQKILEEILEG